MGIKTESEIIEVVESLYSMGAITYTQLLTLGSILVQPREYTPPEKLSVYTNGNVPDHFDDLFIAINDISTYMHPKIAEGLLDYEDCDSIVNILGEIAYRNRIPVALDTESFLNYYSDTSPLGDEPSEEDYGFNAFTYDSDDDSY